MRIWDLRKYGYLKICDSEMMEKAQTVVQIFQTGPYAAPHPTNSEIPHYRDITVPFRDFNLKCFVFLVLQ